MKNWAYSKHLMSPGCWCVAVGPGAHDRQRMQLAVMWKSANQLATRQGEPTCCIRRFADPAETMPRAGWRGLVPGRSGHCSSGRRRRTHSKCPGRATQWQSISRKLIDSTRSNSTSAAWARHWCDLRPGVPTAAASQSINRPPHYCKTSD